MRWGGGQSGRLKYFHPNLHVKREIRCPQEANVLDNQTDSYCQQVTFFIISEQMTSILTSLCNQIDWQVPLPLLDIVLCCLYWSPVPFIVTQRLCNLIKSVMIHLCQRNFYCYYLINWVISFSSQLDGIEMGNYCLLGANQTYMSLRHFKYKCALWHYINLSNNSTVWS